MEQLLAFLSKYGLFIGLVVGTILLFWAIYLIYNAFVRVKTNQKPLPAKTISDTLKTEPVIPTPLGKKTPSLQGDNVVKTGPRKMSMDSDSENEPAPVVKKEIDIKKEEPKAAITETNNQEKKPSNPVPSSPAVSPKPIQQNLDVNSLVSDKNIQENSPSEITQTVVQNPEPKKPREPKKIPLPEEKVVLRPIPKEEIEKPKKAAVAENKKVATEPKVIKVDSISPKPKKKLPPKFHVLYRATDNMWYIKVEGSDAIIATLETQVEAISYATIKALKSDSVVIVHRKDGKIRKQATMKDVIDSEEDE